MILLVVTDDWIVYCFKSPLKTMRLTEALCKNKLFLFLIIGLLEKNFIVCKLKETYAKEVAHLGARWFPISGASYSEMISGFVVGLGEVSSLNNFDEVSVTNEVWERSKLWPFLDYVLGQHRYVVNGFILAGYRFLLKK